MARAKSFDRGLASWYNKTMTGYLILLALLLNVPTVFSQENRNRSDRPPLRPGKVETTINAFGPSSLQQMVDESDLILEGTVAHVHPSRRTHADDPWSLETDLMISPNWIVKGRRGDRILVSQIGGELDGYQLDTPEIPLMRQGARYVLFLLKDTRPNLADVEGLDRYIISGVWSGVFEVVENYPQPNPNTSAAIKAPVAGLDLQRFLNKVATLVR
jgi:hypothetical protein